jgi:hypothetical protein
VSAIPARLESQLSKLLRRSHEQISLLPDAATSTFDSEFDLWWFYSTAMECFRPNTTQSSMSLLAFLILLLVSFSFLRLFFVQAVALQSGRENQALRTEPFPR